MVPIDLFEGFLYLLPILEIILIHLYFRPYLSDQKRVRLSVTDVVLPLLLVSVHIVSLRLIGFSFLPHLFFAYFLTGLLCTIAFSRSQKNHIVRTVLLITRKLAFLYAFFLFYTLMVIRIVQVVKG